MYPHLLLSWKHFLGSFGVLCHNTCCMQMSLNRAVGFLQFRENLGIWRFGGIREVPRNLVLIHLVNFFLTKLLRQLASKSAKLLYEIYMFKETNYSENLYFKC